MDTVKKVQQASAADLSPVTFPNRPLALTTMKNPGSLFDQPRFRGLWALCGSKIHLKTGSVFLNSAQWLLSLTINVPPMSDTHHPDDACTGIYLIDDPVITDTDAPIALGACDLPTSLGSWIFSQLFDFRNDPLEGVWGEPLEVSLSRLLYMDLIHPAETP